MRYRLAILLALASACGGSQEDAAAGSDRRKLSKLEDQLEDARADVAREKAARAAAEQALAETKASCAAQVAQANAKASAAAAAAPPPPVALPPADVAPPGPPPPPKPVVARIIEKNVVGNAVRLIVSAGRKRGVAVNWTAQVYKGKTSKVIATFKVTAVRDDEAEGTTKDVTIAAVEASDRVELLPPPGP